METRGGDLNGAIAGVPSRAGILHQADVRHRRMRAGDCMLFLPQDQGKDYEVLSQKECLHRVPGSLRGSDLGSKHVLT